MPYCLKGLIIRSFFKGPILKNFKERVDLFVI